MDKGYFGLCRVSTINQKDNNSLSNQKKQIQTYCKNNGINLIGFIEEIESGNLKKGLWAKAFSEAEGDENKTKALYIKYRFDQIKEGHKEIEQEEEEVKIDSKLESEKKIVESKIESNNELKKRLLYDFEKQE